MQPPRTPAPLPNAVYTPPSHPSHRVHAAPHPTAPDRVLITYRLGRRLTTATVHRDYLTPFPGVILDAPTRTPGRTR